MVSATREALSLSWVWPGEAPPAVPARSFVLDPAWVQLAASRALAVPALGRGAERARLLAWIGGFFEAAGASEKEDLLAYAGTGKDGWAPYGDTQVDDVLRWWARSERAARRRRRALAELEADVVSVVPSPPRQRRGRVGVDHGRMIGGERKKRPAETVAATPKPVTAVVPESVLLERLELALATVDDVNARIAERLRSYEERRVARIAPEDLGDDP